MGKVALDLVFPPRCVGCGGGGSFLCHGCADSLARAEPPRCRCCWRPGRSGVCAACSVAPRGFDGLRAVFVYAGLARELVHGLKFRGMTALAAPMALLLAAAVHEYGLAGDLIVPVPLAGLRRRTRGYNQAESLARALGHELGLPVGRRALRRTRNTPPQARSDDAGERRRNVADAFRASESEAAGRRILLVDDVTTTGATFDACAGALKAAGASTVWALAFARED